MPMIKVMGKASGKCVRILDCPTPIPKISLMAFLHSHSVRIASSCLGEGVCQKCMVNGDLVSCQISLEDFVALKEDVVVEYL
ncbi:MAG: hypothetical protein JNM93_12860 [Bacteriovoracaceae bacterium]|nr:hypothetical protein [Bacteriovoracaceae bacterium]